MSYINIPDKFIDRHIGPNEADTKEMLKVIGVESIDELINLTIPERIRLKNEIQLDVPVTESEFVEGLRTIAA